MRLSAYNLKEITKKYEIILDTLYDENGPCEVLDLSSYAEITKIGKDAFSDIANIKKVILPPNLELIDAYAFENCAKLEEVIFPDTLSCIEHNAFKKCNLKTFTAPKNLLAIGRNAFSENNIENVFLNKKIKDICFKAFELNKIKFCVIPESLDEGCMDWTAFANQKIRDGRTTLFASKFFIEYEEDYYIQCGIILKENTIENIISAFGFKTANKILNDKNIER